MSSLQIELFGKFGVRCDSEAVKGLDASKVQELFSYLLLRRDRPNTREVLASVLWGDSSTEKSKKYLRQALWHLQAALHGVDGLDSGLSLEVEHDWVQLNLRAPTCVDVVAFEQCCACVRGVPGGELGAQKADELRAAVRLYKGDLLEGWYQDWCLFERERLQNLYLSLLNKLMTHCLAQRRYEHGLEYGALILRHDRASERTHRQLMRLHYMAGDRTAALRQYQRCVEALEEELGVRPESRTDALHEQIRLNRAADPAPDAAPRAPQGEAEEAPPHDLVLGILGRLRQFQGALGRMRRDVRREIRAIELGLKDVKK
jgi:DNA-binding SARP family transcriptional activator